MRAFIVDFIQVLISTLRDLAPITALVVFFQLVVLKQPIPQLRRVLAGMVYVVLGLVFFLMGLEKALFPIGNIMAEQLADPGFVNKGHFANYDWRAYYWIYLFAAMTGFSAAIAEPALIAVAFKAKEVSAGTIDPLGLRVTVAIGVAFALALGTFRIVSGVPLYVFILAGYCLVIVQTLFAPREIIALAYDSGGVTTSTVTVPIVAALGLGLSSSVPGRNPAIDGFGLIAMACLFPIISVLAYAQIVQWRLRKSKPKAP
ncbi:MAG: DUF1538 domain-containing protein [Saprospiraceae bacterium]|jgi:hypothetical protein